MYHQRKKEKTTERRDQHDMHVATRKKTPITSLSELTPRIVGTCIGKHSWHYWQTTGLLKASIE